MMVVSSIERLEMVGVTVVMTVIVVLAALIPDTTLVTVPTWVVVGVVGVGLALTARTTLKHVDKHTNKHKT